MYGIFYTAVENIISLFCQVSKLHDKINDEMECIKTQSHDGKH